MKPWPWADTHPVARLRAPAYDVDLLVLEGANGRTLAWGPGHVEGTATPGARGNAVVTGHRDTHFAFLREVKRGDALMVESADGTTRRYRVERTFVARPDPHSRCRRTSARRRWRWSLAIRSTRSIRGRHCATR